MGDAMAVNADFQLAHVLFMDVVGFSNLLIDDQREVLHDLHTIVRGTEQFRTAEAQQKLICLPTGDGMALVFFTMPDAPARCAIEIARALRERAKIKLRMGIHCGPVSAIADMNEHANVTGGGINMAQRVMDCGDAGHVLLSQRVAEDLSQFREWNASVHDLGECEAKHGAKLHLFNFFGDGFGSPAIPLKLGGRATPSATASSKKLGPVLLTAIICAALGAGTWVVSSLRYHPTAKLATATPIPEKSIAVLPFENLSDDKTNAYFVDGIQDEILTRLAKVADLKVISRTSTQRFKSNPGDLSEIARQLGVAHVLEGSAQRYADQVRVNVQLIKAAGDSHLWAETYDRKLTDVFAVETEIATKIAETLQAKLTGAEHVALAARPTENLEAHELYLKARFFAGKRNGNDLERSIDYYTQALAKDPNYALAYAGIANSYALLQEYSARTPDDVFPKAHDAAAKALALDNNLAEAHAALAFVLVEADLNFKEAKKEFERAVQLNPNSADTRYFFGISVLAPLGQFDQAVAEIRHAISLDPVSAIMNANLGYTYFLSRRFPEAIAQLEKTVEMDPNFPYTHGCMGLALLLSGNVPAAIAEYEKAGGVAKGRGQGGEYHSMVFLAHLYGSNGERGKALRLLHDVEQKERDMGITWAYGYALVQIGLGDKEQAIDWLERSYKSKETGVIPYIKVDPLLDPLRGNPRFEKLASIVIPPD